MGPKLPLFSLMPPCPLFSQLSLAHVLISLLVLILILPPSFCTDPLSLILFKVTVTPVKLMPHYDNIGHKLQKPSSRANVGKEKLDLLASQVFGIVTLGNELGNMEELLF